MFRAMLANGEALYAAAALDGMADRHIEHGTLGTTSLVDGQITFRSTIGTYRFDQLPELIAALEDAFERDRLLALDELREMDRACRPSKPPSA